MNKVEHLCTVAVDMAIKMSTPFVIAIAIIERGKVMGDITVMKIEAIQLGYLCCVELNNSQKQGEFEHQLSELGIAIPDTEQTKIEVYICLHTVQRETFTKGKVDEFDESE